jgi:AcrR family transcriptional regulator
MARKRLPTEERERQIVDGAIEFFSECGLTGQMRELAIRIGITHPLLFHYFPNKAALIQRVYEEVYLGRWKQEWETAIKDRSQSLEQRLNTVYSDYAQTILTKDWVRILVYSAQADGYITDNYLALLSERMLRPIIGETRAALGLADAAAPTEAENELLWGLHGGIFYLGVRHWIYGHSFPRDPGQVVRDRVRAYVLAAAEIFPREAAGR